MDLGSQLPVRYRFDLEGEGALRHDVIVEGGKGRMEPAADTPVAVTLHCDRTTFALLLYSRFSLEAAVAQGRVSVEGNHALAQVLPRVSPRISQRRGRRKRKGIPVSGLIDGEAIE